MGQCTGAVRSDKILQHLQDTTAPTSEYQYSRASLGLQTTKDTHTHTHTHTHKEFCGKEQELPGRAREAYCKRAGLFSSW